MRLKDLTYNALHDHMPHYHQPLAHQLAFIIEHIESCKHRTESHCQHFDFLEISFFIVSTLRTKQAKINFQISTYNNYRQLTDCTSPL